MFGVMYITLYDICICLANLRTKILDFRGFDPSRISILRGGILMSMGNFPGKLESSSLSREILSREIGRRQPRLEAQRPPLTKPSS